MLSIMCLHYLLASDNLFNDDDAYRDNLEACDLSAFVVVVSGRQDFLAFF